MTIAVIGTGNMGTAIARRLARSGHLVLIGGRNLEKARGLARDVGAGAKGTDVTSALAKVNMAFLALPFDAVAPVLSAAGDLTGKVLVDITNPITPDYMSLTIGHTTSAAEEIQKLAVGAQVVKAFNTVFSSVLASPEATGRAPQVFTAADNREVEAEVASTIRSMGFEPIYGGPLKNARYLEPLGELNIHLGYALGNGTMISPAWRGLAA